MQRDRDAIARRNAVLMVIEGTLFWAGLSFLEGNTVISVFMERATGSAAMVGLAATLRQIMVLLGQFIMGMFIHKIRVQRKFMVVMAFICRPMILLMVPVLLTGVTGVPSAIIFLVVYGLIFFTDGFVGMCWNQIAIRTLPLRRRGEVVSLQQTFAGVVGIGTGFALRAILKSELTDAHQFAIIFSLAGLFLIIDAIVLTRFDDVPHPSSPDAPVPHVSRYVAQFVPLFRENRTVRRVLLCRALYLLTLISAPLNILFGAGPGGLTLAQQASLVFMPVAGQVIAGLIWSRVSRRLGYPAIMLSAQGIGVLCSLLSFLSLGLSSAGISPLIPLSATMILIGINTPAYIGFFHHMMEAVEEQRRALTMVLASLVLAPLAFGTTLAGWLCERFGYAPVYAIMLIGGIAGLAITWYSFFSRRSDMPEAHRHGA